MKKFALALAAASISVTGMAAPAFAGTASSKTIKVEYADLNLNTMNGQATLERRLDKAAKRACDFNDARTGTRIQSKAAKECLAKARASAKQQFAAVMEDQRRGG
jgi:UrcA family protein